MAGYGTDQGFEDWLTLNGYVLSVSAPAPAILRQRGSVYIDGLYGERFTGSPTGEHAQERQWPRTDAVFGRAGTAIDENTIPAQVIEASYFAAYQEGLSPGSLSVSASGAGRVKRQKVDVVEREFFEGSGNAAADATPVFSQIEGLLAPLLMASATSLNAGPYLV
jgi:hypothetical protein